jgi:hypothetical protein
VGSCEHGNLPSGSITGEEFLNQLSNYQIFKEGRSSQSYEELYILVYKDAYSVESQPVLSRESPEGELM